MNVVVSNVKGGVGKTTTAVYLAAAAVARGHDPVVLIDADRQASSAEWLEERPVEGVTFFEAPSERTLTRAMNGHEGWRSSTHRPATSDSCSPPSTRPMLSSSRPEPEGLSSHA
jgi:cellulose biosynthesis protein BcsQ